MSPAAGGAAATGGAGGGLSLASLRERFSFASKGGLRSLLEELHPKLAAARGAFIHLQPLEALLERAEALEAQPAAERGALWGVPFAVKDNIDVAGLPTTAACPAFAYTPDRGAPCVEALLAAGGVMVGKTNLDQFASGLVGTRSPYGVAANAFDSRFIPGGSSSGSAALVGAGLVCFALGTDTAGSGRVPAGYNGCVGVKPTVGSVSSVGVVPACAALDCATVFAGSVADAAEVARIMASGDAGPGDVWRRTPAPVRPPPAEGKAFRFGVPGPAFLEWAGKGGPEMAAANSEQFSAAVARLKSLGGTLVEDFDFSPFADVAAMLYQSSFVAERYSGLHAFLDKGAPGAAAAEAAAGGAPEVALARQRALVEDERLLRVTRAIISGAGKFTAVDVFDDTARMAVLRARARDELGRVDAILVPTTLEAYLVAEIEEEEGADPPTWPSNAKNGRFTNFVNLLDLAGISVPAGLVAVDYGAGPSAETPRAALLKRLGGPLRVVLPFGVTLLGPAWHDEWLWGVAERMAQAAGLGCGPAGHGVEAVVV